MYCTVKEIIRDVLDTDVPDSECVFAVVLTRGGTVAKLAMRQPFVLFKGLSILLW